MGFFQYRKGTYDSIFHRYEIVEGKQKDGAKYFIVNMMRDEVLGWNVVAAVVAIVVFYFAMGACWARYWKRRRLNGA